jgi:hypothetical protein
MSLDPVGACVAISAFSGLECAQYPANVPDKSSRAPQNTTRVFDLRRTTTTTKPA